MTGLYVGGSAVMIAALFLWALLRVQKKRAQAEAEIKQERAKDETRRKMEAVDPPSQSDVVERLRKHAF